MDIINLPVGGGKTKALIQISDLTDTPIICASKSDKENIAKTASYLGARIPEPYTIFEYLDALGNDEVDVDGILIDEPFKVLQKILEKRMYAVAFSDEEYDFWGESRCDVLDDVFQKRDTLQTQWDSEETVSQSDDGITYSFKISRDGGHYKVTAETELSNDSPIWRSTTYIIDSADLLDKMCEIIDKTDITDKEKLDQLADCFIRNQPQKFS